MAAPPVEVVKPEPVLEKPVRTPVEPIVESTDSAASEAEYPDPTMDMSLEELRELAKVYQVPIHGRTGKKKLVADIHAAMYD